MSEDNQKTKADLILERINAIQADWQTEFNKIKVELGKVQPETHNANHKDVDDLLNCANCKAKVLEKIKPDIEKQISESVLKAKREKNKAMKKPVLCEDCGEVLDREQEENCPSCKGHRY